MMWKGVSICGVWIGSALAIYCGAVSEIFICTTIATVVIAVIPKD